MLIHSQTIASVSSPRSAWDAWPHPSLMELGYAHICIRKPALVGGAIRTTSGMKRVKTQGPMASGGNQSEEVQRGVEAGITCLVCHDHFQEPVSFVYSCTVYTQCRVIPMINSVLKQPLVNRFTSKLAVYKTVPLPSTIQPHYNSDLVHGHSLILKVSVTTCNIYRTIAHTYVCKLYR